MGRHDAVLIWLALDFAALGMAYQLAGKFLDAEVTVLDASRWRRKFVFAETLRELHGRRLFGSLASPVTPPRAAMLSSCFCSLPR